MFRALMTKIRDGVRAVFAVFTTVPAGSIAELPLAVLRAVPRIVPAVLFSCLLVSGCDSPTTARSSAGEQRAASPSPANNPHYIKAKACAKAIRWKDRGLGNVTASFGEWKAASSGVAFYGVKYHGKSGVAICAMDGNTVTGIGWKDPHTGRTVEVR